MLVTNEEKNALTKGLRLVTTSKGSGYYGSDMWDVRTYQGNKGSGFTAAQKSATEYWIDPAPAEILPSVYRGKFCLDDVTRGTNISYFSFLTKNKEAVEIVPSWELVLDSRTGETRFHMVTFDEDIRPSCFSDGLVIVSWRGPANEEWLRGRLRRLMRDAVRTGKAYISNKKEC